MVNKWVVLELKGRGEAVVNGDGNG